MIGRILPAKPWKAQCLCILYGDQEWDPQYFRGDRRLKSGNFLDETASPRYEYSEWMS
jgi:hypothetical protein